MPAILLLPQSIPVPCHGLSRVLAGSAVAVQLLLPESRASQKMLCTSLV